MNLHMNKNSTSQSAIHPPSPTRFSFCAASVVITLLGFGAFSAQAQLKQQVIMQSTDPLVPVGFDCSRISELGIDKQENLRAGAIMIACGEAQGGKPSASSALFEAIKSALAPLGVWCHRRRSSHWRRDISECYTVRDSHCK